MVIRLDVELVAESFFRLRVEFKAVKTIDVVQG